MAVFVDPTVSIVNKMRASTRLTALIAASRIHVAFPKDDPDTPGIYVQQGFSPLRQIVSSANQTGERVLMGEGSWYVEGYSKVSMEQAESLARIACEVCLPSIPDAGLFSLDFQFELQDINTDIKAYRVGYSLRCPLREWRVPV